MPAVNGQKFRNSNQWLLIKSLTPIFIILLSGCGANEVMQVGPSGYQVSAQELLLSGGWPTAQREAMAKGTQYCASKGQQFTIFDEKQGGVPGFSPLSSTITFTCGLDIKTEVADVRSDCTDEMKSLELEPIRGKVELYHENPDAPPPFEIASNDAFPTVSERPVIAIWAKIRDRCDMKLMGVPLPPSANALQTVYFQQVRSFATEAIGRVSDLIIALYEAKLTYGEFAQKQYEITRDAAAAERQFRAATVIADQQRQMQAEQLAQQQFQTTLAAWSSYMQTVNARQPQTVTLQGTVRLQTNCNTLKTGNFSNTNCN